MDAQTAALAFDVGGTTIKAEVLGADLDVWGRLSGPTPRGIALVDAIVEIAHELLAGLPVVRQERVRSVGMAFPGLVDAGRGVSLYAANLGLRDAPVAQAVSDRLELPVHLDHDVKIAAAAERQIGAARELVDPIVVIIGTGISAVSYVRGERVVGISGQAGELGHVVVRPGGPLCGCGNRGCLEAVASASAVVRAYSEIAGRTVRGAEEVVSLLGHDDAADRVWQESTSALADGLLAASALLAPGGIVLGGGLAEAGDALLTPVAAKMHAAGRVVATPPLVRAALGGRAGVVGAALLAFGTSGRSGGQAAPDNQSAHAREDG